MVHCWVIQGFSHTHLMLWDMLYSDTCIATHGEPQATFAITINQKSHMSTSNPSHCQITSYNNITCTYCINFKCVTIIFNCLVYLEWWESLLLLFKLLSSQLLRLKDCLGVQKEGIRPPYWGQLALFPGGCHNDWTISSLYPVCSPVVAQVLASEHRGCKKGGRLLEGKASYFVLWNRAHKSEAHILPWHLPITSSLSWYMGQGECGEWKSTADMWLVASEPLSIIDPQHGLHAYYEYQVV